MSTTVSGESKMTLSLLLGVLVVAGGMMAYRENQISGLRKDLAESFPTKELINVRFNGIDKKLDDIDERLGDLATLRERVAALEAQSK